MTYLKHVATQDSGQTEQELMIRAAVFRVQTEALKNVDAWLCENIDLGVQPGDEFTEARRVLMRGILLQAANKYK